MLNLAVTRTLLSPWLPPSLPNVNVSEPPPPHLLREGPEQLPMVQSETVPTIRSYRLALAMPRRHPQGLKIETPSLMSCKCYRRPSCFHRCLMFLLICSSLTAEESRSRESTLELFLNEQYLQPTQTTLQEQTLYQSCSSHHRFQTPPPHEQRHASLPVYHKARRRSPQRALPGNYSLPRSPQRLSERTLTSLRRLSNQSQIAGPRAARAAVPLRVSLSLMALSMRRREH